MAPLRSPRASMMSSPSSSTPTCRPAAATISCAEVWTWFKGNKRHWPWFKEIKDLWRSWEKLNLSFRRGIVESQCRRHRSLQADRKLIKILRQNLTSTNRSITWRAETRICRQQIQPPTEPGRKREIRITGKCWASSEWDLTFSSQHSRAARLNQPYNAIGVIKLRYPSPNCHARTLKRFWMRRKIISWIWVSRLRICRLKRSDNKRKSTARHWSHSRTIIHRILSGA